MNFSLDAVAFTKFRMAVRRGSRKDDSGHKKDVTDFFNVIVWNRGTYRLAELCITHLAKGDPVGVHGRLEQDDWKTPTGETKERVVIKASDVDSSSIHGRQPRSQPSRHAATGARTGGAGAVPDPVPALVTVGGSDGAKAPATAASQEAEVEVAGGDAPGSDPRPMTPLLGLAPWIRRTIPSGNRERQARRLCATDGAAPAVWAEGVEPLMGGLWKEGTGTPGAVRIRRDHQQLSEVINPPDRIAQLARSLEESDADASQFPVVGGGDRGAFTGIRAATDRLHGAKTTILSQLAADTGGSASASAGRAGGCS